MLSPHFLILIRSFNKQLVLQPVLTAFWAVLLLEEQLTGWHIGGGVLVIAGIYLVQKSQYRQE